VFLNDWGCAVKIGQAVKFEGALRQAPARILKTNDPYLPQPKDDLIMVVRVLFQVMCHGLYQTIAGSATKETILQFWKKMLVSKVWRTLLKAAKDTNYSKLQECIKKLLP